MICVSILMPCFNNELFLEEAIASVVEQNYTDWELLICDDGSADGSIQIAERWASKDQRIKVLKNKFEKGAPGARNTSLAAACGKYIAFLDADDVWYRKSSKNKSNIWKKQEAYFAYRITMS